MFTIRSLFKTLFLIALIMGLSLSLSAQSPSKAVIYYTSLSDLKTFYSKPGKDKAGADLIPVYFEELKKNKGRVVDFYYLIISEDKKSIDITAVYKGDKIDKKFKNILFYADPMYPSDLTLTKKKDDMGMDYAPFYFD